MNVLRSAALTAASAAACALAAPVAAETVDIGEILVTPNRTPTEKSKVGSTVETVDAAEIEAQGKPRLTDYLSLLPGVYVAPPGGLGQETSLSIRGADKKYVKTLFNGIDISDPTATQVQTPFEHLMTGGVTSVEVLKGSQSTLYGADAVAGVIGISTLGDIAPGVHHDLGGEGGSFGTLRGGYTLSAASETGKASLNLVGLTTDGISAADEDAGNPEADSYRNVTATFAGEQAFGEAFSVFGAGLYVDSNAEFDDAGSPPTDNPFNDTDVRQLGGRIGANADLLDGRFRNTVSAQIFDIDRDLHLVSMFGPYDATYSGRRLKADYVGAFDAADWATVQVGADYETQSADVTDNFGTDTYDNMAIAGLWTQAILEPVENLTLTGGVRHDEHDQFGGYTTYRVTGAYRFPEAGAKLHASFGTGFRAPSLYELFAPFGIGNPDLEPEKSTSYDLGLEKTFLGGAMVADVTYFRLNTDDLIDYSYSAFTYVQIPGRTRRNGVETSLVWSPAPWLDLGAAYTYTRTREPSGARRPRIPKHDFALTATARPAERWEISVTAHAAVDVQDRISPSSGTFEDVPLDDYVTVDARVSYRPTETVELFVRGENLFDQDYQVVKGFGTPGIAVYAGLRARF